MISEIEGQLNYMTKYFDTKLEKNKLFQKTTENYFFLPFCLMIRNFLIILYFRQDMTSPARTN